MSNARHASYELPDSLDDINAPMESKDLFGEIESFIEQIKPGRQRMPKKRKPVAHWIERQLSLDFAQDVIEYMLEVQASEQGCLEIYDADREQSLDELVIDDAFVERWVANMGPFDLARAMLLEAIRDLAIGTADNRKSAVAWLIDDEGQGLSFPVCVEWLTEVCTVPGRKTEIVMPEDLNERVEHFRDACLERPHEIYHLLKNYEDFSDYSKEKLQVLREQNLPTARELVREDEQGRARANGNRL